MLGVFLSMMLSMMWLLLLLLLLLLVLLLLLLLLLLWWWWWWWWWCHDREPSEKEAYPRTINCWFRFGFRAVILNKHVLHRKHRFAVMENTVEHCSWNTGDSLFCSLFRCLCNINHLHSVSQCQSPSPSAGKCRYWRTDKNQGTNERCFLIVCSEKKFITTPTEKWLVKLYSSFIVVHGVLSGSHLVGTVPTTLQTVTVLMPEIWQIAWKVSLKICKSCYTMWQAATPDVVHGRLKHHQCFAESEPVLTFAPNTTNPIDAERWLSPSERIFLRLPRSTKEMLRCCLSDNEGKDGDTSNMNQS